VLRGPARTASRYLIGLFRASVQQRAMPTDNLSESHVSPLIGIAYGDTPKRLSSSVLFSRRLLKQTVTLERFASRGSQGSITSDRLDLGHD